MFKELPVPGESGGVDLPFPSSYPQQKVVNRSYGIGNFRPNIIDRSSIVKDYSKIIDSDVCSLKVDYFKKANDISSLKLLEYIFGKNLKSEEKNYIYSPFSISYILSILLFGTRKDTLKQLSHFLGLSNYLQSDGQNKLMSNLFKNLIIMKDQFDKEENRKTISITNAFFVDETFYSFIKPDYIKLVRHLGLINGINFSKKELSARLINEWISDKTKGMIKNTISPEDIDSTLNKLLLVNTIYFNSNWKYNFLGSLTEKSSFHQLLNQKNYKFNRDNIFKKEKDVFLMSFLDYEDLNYYEGEGCQVVELPYENEELVFGVIILHDSVLRYDLLSYRNRMKNYKVKVYLPKFTSEMKIDLNDPMISHGCVNLFSESIANLIPITRKESYVSKIIHKSKIIIDEGSIKSSCSTSNSTIKNFGFQMEDDKKIFKANKTFQYYLLHKPSQTILFSGLFN